jgi:DNA polymerase-3 subunit delta
LGTVDLWQVESEIKKIISYNHKITIESIKELIVPSINTSIFNLIDAINNRNRTEAFAVVSQLLEKGENELYLLSMIQKQLRNLVLIRELRGDHKEEGQIARELKIHPFVVKKGIWALNKIKNLDTLAEFYRQTIDCENSIKNGAKEPSLASETLIVGLTTQKPAIYAGF